LKIVLLITFTLNTLLLAQETITPISVQAISLNAVDSISIEEISKTQSITVQDALANDVSFNTITDAKGEGALSFRGLGYKATSFIEDGIPLYRSIHGFSDAKQNFINGTLSVNDGSHSGTLGVSSIGAEITLHTEIPLIPFSSQLKTSISTNDEYYHAYVGSRMKNIYVQANVDYYHRADFELSSNFETTPLQTSKYRLNSDSTQESISIKSGVFLDNNFHLAAKLAVTKSKYGIAPNTFTDLANPVWDAYSRIDKKNLNSFYLYGDYKKSNLSITTRAYYDEYEDSWLIYYDPSYQSSWPSVTYNDHRLGASINSALQYSSHKSELILSLEENQHIRKGGGWNDATFTTLTLNSSYIHDWQLSQNFSINGALSYNYIFASKAVDLGVQQQPENKVSLDASIKTRYNYNDSSLYFGIAKKSRMPVIGEIYAVFPFETSNPDLKPESALQYTLQYQQFFADASLLNLTLYYYDIKNHIFFQNGNEYVNQDKATNYGAELQFESDYFSNNYLRFSYTFSQTQNSEGEAIALIPEHSLKIEDTITLTKDIESYISYQYIGDRASYNTATYTNEQMKLSSYNLLNLQLSYTFTQAFNVRVGIKNILDTDYQSQYGYPAEGRSLYTSLTWNY